MTTFASWVKAHKKTLIEIGFGFLLGLAFGVAISAEAADANVSWTHPTQRTDNTALPLSEIQKTVVEWGLCSGGNFPATPAGTRDVPAPATTTSVTGLAYGTWCFRAFTVDTGGMTSTASNTAVKAFIAPPKPPVLTVAAGATVYELNVTGNGAVKLGRSVGTVLYDTECGAVYVGDTFAVVPDEAVALDDHRSPKSSVVVAECTPT